MFLYNNYAFINLIYRMNLQKQRLRAYFKSILVIVSNIMRSSTVISKENESNCARDWVLTQSISLILSLWFRSTHMCQCLIAMFVKLSQFLSQIFLLAYFITLDNNSLFNYFLTLYRKHQIYELVKYLIFLFIELHILY